MLKTEAFGNVSHKNENENRNRFKRREKIYKKTGSSTVREEKMKGN
jgi:hypothetical protein